VRGLVTELLEHKEEHAVERLFRLFSLRYPREDFKRIHRGVTSADRKARSSARELLEGALDPPVRDAVLGLLDEVPDELRLAAGRLYHRRTVGTQADVLRALLGESGVPVRCLVAYHVAELGMHDLRPELSVLCKTSTGVVEESFRHALEMLENPGKEHAFVVPVR
jgi:hypothetical protein